MRKSSFILIFVYAALIILLITSSLMSVFQIDLTKISQDWFRFYRVVLIVGLFSLSLAVVFLVLIQITSLNTKYQLNRQLKRILANKALRQQAGDEYSQILQQLAVKMRDMTESLQSIENQDLVTREAIVEEERKRVARELHDTVSQELFAASMILSGLSGQVEDIPRQQMGQQLELVSGLLDTAQKDLRVLLLHLRPLELEGRTLVEGLELVLQEVKDKSNIKVTFTHDTLTIPKTMEAHIFRIAQEFVNNTLRHAQAKQLEVYLLQSDYEIQLRMADDGIGYDQGEIGEVSYGLNNIKERVADMAGSLKVTTAPRKGVAMDIRIPLTRSEEIND